MPPIKYTPTDVVEAVNDHERATADLRTRMDDDFEKRWALAKYEGPTDDDQNSLEGFRKYTSNDSRAYAKKLISLISAARVIWKINQDGDDEQMRGVNDDKERFAHGVIQVNDERLEAEMQGPLHDQMAWFGANRGKIANLVLLIKKTDGGDTTTTATIQPLDARNLFWAEGKGGLMWACHKTKKSTTAIEDEYPGVNLESADPQELHDVYNFFDREKNFVCTEEEVLKSAENHGDTKVPINIVNVGPAPLISGSSVGQEQHGESVYDTSRDQWDETNFTMSVLSTMSERSLRQGLKYKSPDGTATFDRDPYLSGNVVTLAEGEDVEPLGLLEVAKELPGYQALVMGQAQRGALPYTAFGEVGIALSGFAITRLSEQQGDAIKGLIQAIQSAYKQAMDTIVRQYTSGNFTTLSLSGLDKKGKFFEKSFPPELIEAGGRYMVRVVPQLPKDDASRFQVAQIARDRSTGAPLYSDRRVLEDILEVEDADLITVEVKNELAERSSPLAGLRELMLAAADRGDTQLAMIYLREVQQQLMKETLETMQVQAAIFATATGLGGPQGGGSPSPSTNGASRNGASGPQPIQLPGIPPQQGGSVQGAPIQQQGPLVAPGTPRPGAQGPESDSVRLAKISLVPPR